MHFEVGLRGIVELIVQGVLLILPFVGSVFVLAQQIGQCFDTLYPSLC